MRTRLVAAALAALMTTAAEAASCVSPQAATTLSIGAGVGVTPDGVGYVSFYYEADNVGAGAGVKLPPR